jgi:3-isopropylmalate/(R)-2-methylmalate dehydratase large subunit
VSTTLAQKIIARAAGRTSVEVGEVVTARIDLAMIHDSGGPRRVAPLLAELGTGLHNPDQVVLIADHYVPGDSDEGRQILRFTRDWAQREEVVFHDSSGICHIVLPQQGHLRPGMLVVGGDSHSCTGGAMGTYMFGVGATDMAGALATGEIWLKVPGTIMLEWQGVLADGVGAKDMMLYTCGLIGMDGGEYQAIEYSGDTITRLPMQERMTLSNMAAELGAQAGLIAPDATTLEFLAHIESSNANHYSRTIELPDPATLATDTDAPLLRHHRLAASALAPQVAAPHSPANAMPVTDGDSTAINMAYIGACTGAKYHDMRAAARVIGKRRVASGVRMMLAPASLADQQRAADDGTLQTLQQAGAQLLPSACGICAGYGADRLDADAVCISSTARNFKGRMGDPESQVWLGSAMTVAASALTGRITDPREFLIAGAADA